MKIDLHKYRKYTMHLSKNTLITVLLLSTLCSLLSISCKQQEQQRKAYPPYPEMIKPADSLFLAGDYPGAIRTYRQVLQAYPDSTDTYWVLGRAYLGIGMFEDARTLLGKARYTRDTLSMLSKYRRHAIWAIFKGDTTALRKYTDSLMRYAFHTYPDPYLNAAFNEVFLKDYQGAMDHLQRYTVYGQPETTPINMGFLHLKIGDSIKGMEILGEAETRVTRVLLETPADPDALFELAEIYVMKNDTAVAMNYLERAFHTGLGKEWWVYHLLSNESVSDPVFAPLRGNPRFERIRDSLLNQRQLMKAEVMSY